MKKNNLFYLSFILLAAACSKTKGPQTLISRWDKNLAQESVVERRLASAQAGQCLNDIFNVETLKAEVKALEKKYSGAKMVSGRWKHLELSRLPVPQANFLKEYGNELGDLANPDAFDYSQAEDVPGIFNVIYGNAIPEAGYVHYLWYLKFGHMLSADNKVPKQIGMTPGIYGGKVLPFSAYLFDSKELYGFWRLSLMLREPHTTLTNLKEVQRVPRGEKFDKPEYAGSCGLAYSDGSITLTDTCLWFDRNSIDRGYFYASVTHELSHQLDFLEGRGTSLFYRSHKPDYLQHAGLTLTEFVDASGALVNKWEIVPGTKFIRDYAKGSPQENFADSVAYVRIDGDMADKNMAAAHVQFLQRDYYQNRKFDTDSMQKEWLRSYSTENQVFKAVIECNKSAGTVKSTYFKKTDFGAPIAPSMLNCFGANAEIIAANTKAKILISEPDGCNSINDFPGKAKWDPYVKENLTQAFNKYLLELQNDKEYLARIQAFYNQLSDKTIAREAYLQCYGERDEEPCYQTEIGQRAIEKAAALKVPEEKSQEMAAMYVAQHSYADIKQDITKSYQIIVNSNKDDIQREANEVWDRCEAINQNDDERPTGSHFQPKEGYLISSFFNCLNAQIPDTLADTIRNVAVDGMKTQHPKEELIIGEEVKPIFMNKLQDLYRVANEQEMLGAMDYIELDNGGTKTKLLSNFSWVKSISNTSQIISDCRMYAFQMISFSPLYHQKKDLFSDYVNKNVCQNIANAPQFTNWVENSRNAFKDKVAPGVDIKMEELARFRAQQCAKDYPINNFLVKIVNKVRRQSCLERDWNKLEYQVLAATSNDPTVKKYQINAETIQNHLDEKRLQLQQQMAQEYFAK